MKKIISVFASLLVLICFLGCSNPAVPSVPVDTPETSETSDTPEPIETSDSVEAPERVEPTLPKVPVEETYTVWTFSRLYSYFSVMTGIELEDDITYSYSLTKTERDNYLQKAQQAGIITDEDMHQWTKSQIKDWFIGHYSPANAEFVTAWFVTENYCIVIFRLGNMVYCILK